MSLRSLAIAAAMLLAGVSASGCAVAGADTGLSAGGRVDVVSSFYPLQFAAKQVGGDHVHVSDLTKPGAEPHEVELSPRDVAQVSTADLVVYERGLQPAVDQAVQAEAGGHAFDVAPSARLDLTFAAGVGASRPAAAAGSGDGAPGTVDPHFWLDPTRYADVAGAIAERLAALDPAHRADYRAGARAFEARLATLDSDFTKGLSNCRRHAIVTSHSAFGYLAEAYGMTQVGISGLSPEAEPEPSTLADVARYVRDHDVTTIYSETLVSPAIADTVARETGATVAVLDPIEGLTDKSAGSDYFEIMRANLHALRAGQGCS